MIILTNCLTNTADEGSLKVASALVNELKATLPDVQLISYGEEHSLCDHFVVTNKLMLNRKLFSLLRCSSGPILYMPFPAKMISTAVRVFVLAVASRKSVHMLLPMRASKIGFLSRALLKLARTHLIVLSQELLDDYTQLFGECVSYVKAGVDTQRFSPVSSERKQELRYQYGIPSNKPVLLHVGHLKYGRNLSALFTVNDDFHIILAVSSLTAGERDEELKEKLCAMTNLTLLDEFLPRVEELYQLADVYFFPVTDEAHCISAPLSVLEAAACDLPIVCTEYSELKQLISRKGFYRVESFEPQQLNLLLQAAVEAGEGGRASVMEYDWKQAAKSLITCIASTRRSEPWKIRKRPR